MIIDFHTHVFPDKIAKRTIDVLEENIMKVEKKPLKAFHPATLESLKNTMKRAGVDYSVVMPIATTIKQSESINRYAKEINGKDGIISFGSLHPLQDDWERTLEGIAEDGLLGIKLHPEYQGVDIDSHESLRVLKKAEELGLITMIHAGADIGMEPPYHCLPHQLRHVLEEVSGEYIIAAHMGGWRHWDEVEKQLAGTSIYMDISYVSRDMPLDQFVRIVKKHGADRILFGTDSPWESPEETIEFLTEAGLSNEEFDKITYKNAKKILKLQ